MYILWLPIALCRFRQESAAERNYRKARLVRAFFMPVFARRAAAARKTRKYLPSSSESRDRNATVAERWGRFSIADKELNVRF